MPDVPPPCPQPRGPGSRWHRGRPPWWPEGEPWPPAGRPWRAVPGRFRRRLLLVTLLFFGVLFALGVGFGAVFWHDTGGSGPWWGQRPGRGGRPGPGPFPGVFIVAGVVGVVATTIAYRRVAGPVGDLLEAASRVGGGDYQRRLQPRGPREVQDLMRTFNEMSERLEAADVARRRFLADVTHELRTPLAVLQSGIEAQLDGIHSRDDAHLSSLLDETLLLARVVDDLHTLALAGAGRLTLHREPVDPAVLVADSVASHGAAAAARGVALVAETGEGGRGPEPIEADPVRLRQVLANLIGNALRATPPGGRVTVGVVTLDGWVRFTVSDTGPGFSPEQLPSLFDRYTKSADSGGSGLGLAIARDLVEAHGGAIEAANRPAGGASVSFRLPASGPAGVSGG